MLNVIYSNSMSQLAAHLAESQQHEPLPPLQAETVMVQSNELARWLNLYLASNQSIAAHIEFPFPSAWLWKLFRQVWPEIPRESPYSTDAMSLKIFELLPTIRKQPEFEAISRYLGETDDARKMLDLAQRIADSFDQYLMYRPDWIAQWEAGKTNNWQGALWQLLTQNDSEPMHRARLLQKMQQALKNKQFPSSILPPRIAIFGLTAMPPIYLDLLAEIAEFTDVSIYFLSPSEGYWGDLLNQKSQAKQRLLFDDEDDFADNGHPLLASLGKLGQTFFEQLQALPHEAEMLYLQPQASDLLSQLKQDIYQLDSDNQKFTVSADDDSVQIHSCHSAMREAEVLHDQLLDLFEKHADLSPTDVVVMTPDIEKYAPVIEAVFSSQPAERFIPFSIASRGDAQQQTLISAFTDLLALPQSRFDAETIMRLLECAAIQRQFRLDHTDLDTIRGWLRETHIRWGLDGQDKQKLGLAALDANTWRAGLDRLLLGYALPPAERDQWQLFNNQLPISGISGERAQLMAQLNAFIDQLSQLRDVLNRPRSPADWQIVLADWLRRLFKIGDENEQLQLDAVLKGINSLTESAQQVGFEQTLSIDVVRDWLDLHIELPGAEHQFMGRGLTFCDMVPMRSIPFDVVCLIGMNDNSYPRRQPKPGFDLLSNDYRRGDRSRRDDDRYLFLEAILSANRHLYISYVGASIHDNAVIPPSVLVSDFNDVLSRRFQTEQGGEIWEQLLTRHPLQALSPRYFSAEDNKLFSFNADACPPPQKQAETESWFTHKLPDADDSWRFVSLKQLIQFFSHPAKFLAQHRLGIFYENEDATLEIREPFALDGLEAWSMRQQMLDGRLATIDQSQIQPVINASGVLPHGHFGELLFEQQLETVDAFTDKLQPLRTAEPIPPLAFEFDCEDFTLTGQLEGLSKSGLLHYRLAKMKAKDLLGLWCSHLVLNCLQPEGVALQSQLQCEDNYLMLQPVENPQQLLAELLDIYWQGLHQPIPFLPKTSLAYAAAELNAGKADSEKEAYKAWTSGFTAGEDADPYHQLLFQQSPLTDEFQSLSLRVYQPIWDAMEGDKL
ncbi:MULTISPECIES: exodeoxyribonuclease V subunit gamma [unclassified Methylophaga]|jgi:exodeoxyribonuclease V gamma subunit|uniref:exodeoxyribonuclease V subunit gamma n=2 Tax=Methylophaga TaxID=40222 RepID=UPI000C8E81DE|nr:MULTISPECIES: exodeoxyribonuclease V subunit gamma [unclassified Methylophaga]MAK65937.1 exodeoxyribonuclease V subunit gamma [Methylophaga sp.]MAY18686.1 exodeoxyribonuclease V subunit gamma [Methylophaga sp.]|tara:strand:+ start:5427 stop:8627 length:3201 start_codon:yes stop_codon:yes gene_type:complete